MPLDRAERGPRGRVQIVDLEVVTRIGGHDGDGHAVDHRHQAIGLVLLDGDVGRELHDPDRPAVRVQHGVVGRLQPHAPARLVEPCELARGVLPVAQVLPEPGIVGARGVIGIDEDPVMAADDLVERVAEHAEEVLVRSQNRAVHGELDGGERTVERVELGFRVVESRFAKHQQPP